MIARKLRIRSEQAQGVDTPLERVYTCTPWPHLVGDPIGRGATVTDAYKHFVQVKRALAHHYAQAHAFFAGSLGYGRHRW